MDFPSSGMQTDTSQHRQPNYPLGSRGSIQKLDRFGQLQIPLDSTHTNPNTTPTHYRACRASPKDWQDIVRQGMFFQYADLIFWFRTDLFLYNLPVYRLILCQSRMVLLYLTGRHIPTVLQWEYQNVFL